MAFPPKINIAKDTPYIESYEYFVYHVSERTYPNYSTETMLVKLWNWYLHFISNYNYHLEFHQNGILPKGLLQWWTAQLPEEIDGILHQVARSKELAVWLLHLDLVGLKLQSEVKLQLQAGGHSLLLWEWWLKPQLLDKADSDKPQVQLMQQDGTKNQELLLLDKECKPLCKAIILWWLQHLECLKWLGHIGRRTSMIEINHWQMKS
jgi:hypothetical protein